MDEQTQASNSQADNQDQAAQSSQAAAGSQSTQATQTAESTSQAAQRPEWMPEAAWDAEKGSPKLDDLGKDYKSLADFKAQADAAKAALPESADEYETKLPGDFKLPEGWKLDQPDHPFLKDARELAHAKGLSQDQYENLVALGIKEQVRQSTALTEAVGLRDKALGANGAERVETLNRWFAAEFGNDVGKQMSTTLFTPEIVKAFESIKQTLVTQGVSGFAQGGRGSQGRTDGRPENWDGLSALDRRAYTLQEQQAGARR